MINLAHSLFESSPSIIFNCLSHSPIGIPNPVFFFEVISLGKGKAGHVDNKLLFGKFSNEEIEIPTSIANSNKLFKYLGKLKGWDKDAFKEALANTEKEGEIIVWG